MAKWVRKVDALPGGGEANTYYDFVGPGLLAGKSSVDNDVALTINSYHDS